MDLLTFSAVIAAAAMHAGWNAVVKLRLDPLLAMVLVAGSATLLAAPLLAVTGWPARASWPWLAASVALHLGYYVTLSAGYARAEMSLIYPLARGGAPMLTALVSVAAFGESLSATQIAAIVALGAGIMLASLSGRGGWARQRAALGFAAATAVTISGYTLVDGRGARAAGDPHAYTAALFALEAFPLIVWTIRRRGVGVFGQMRPFLWQGALAGALSFASYWIAIWAMTRAPIPLVAAARESSVLFAAAIAYFGLREQLSRRRIIACLVIVAALALLRAA